MADARILAVDDDEMSCQLLHDILVRGAYVPTTAPNAEAALLLLKKQAFDCVMSDLMMPGMDGLMLLRAIRELDGAIPVIIVTAYASIDSAVEATKEGAYGYLTKPLTTDRVLHLVGQAVAQRRLHEENALLRKALLQDYRYDDILGKSPRILEVFRLLTSLAGTESTILIQGRSGTGKELVARAIHAHSRRSERPFVAVNCASLPDSLLESELFGHVRGAFTGAIATKRGLFQEAHTGTLFLDEIGETSLGMQVKLLRVLQDGEVRPVGTTKAAQVDVRIVAATNRDLARAMSDGRFREDLFYRLNIITIALPDLKDRLEDLSLLVEHFLAKSNAKFRKGVKRLSPEALTLLLDHGWPGNVRELENCIERAVALGDGDIIGPELLPPQIRDLHAGGPSPVEGMLDDLIDRAVDRALIRFGGNRRKAALSLGISERTLYRRLHARAGGPEALSSRQAGLDPGLSA